MSDAPDSPKPVAPPSGVEGLGRVEPHKPGVEVEEEPKSPEGADAFELPKPLVVDDVPNPLEGFEPNPEEAVFCPNPLEAVLPKPEEEPNPLVEEPNKPEPVLGAAAWAVPKPLDDPKPVDEVVFPKPLVLPKPDPEVLAKPEEAGAFEPEKRPAPMPEAVDDVESDPNNPPGVGVVEGEAGGHPVETGAPARLLKAFDAEPGVGVVDVAGAVDEVAPNLNAGATFVGRERFSAVFLKKESEGVAKGAVEEEPKAAEALGAAPNDAVADPNVVLGTAASVEDG